MSMDAILNAARREAARVVAMFAGNVVGTIISYDSAAYAVKVKYQPEGTLSGWLPLDTPAVGMQIGPTIGQAVLVGFHEGDREAGLVLGRYYNDKNPAPVSVKEGEFSWSAFGASFLFKNDGTVTLTGKGGQTIVMDATGNIILTPAGSGQVQVGGTGGLAAARNNDPVTLGHVVATSTKVTIV